MEHAWLDSLSEDWVSQPDSDNSDCQLPPPKPAEKQHTRDLSSRSTSNKVNVADLSHSDANDGPISPLSERSASEINMSWRRMPSKLSQELKQPPNQGSRQVSVSSSNGSVIHNTVQHEPSAVEKGGTPEWKRRLVDGAMDYGEQRDLFCSAANGLQDMFRPPAEHPTIAEEDEEEEDDQPEHETTMPSSPPLYARRRVSIELEQEVSTLEEAEEEPGNPNDVTPSPSPRRAQRELRYRLNTEELLDTPSNPPTNRANIHKPEDVDIFRDESCLTANSVVANETRKTSGQSDTRNEDFSPILIGKQSDHDGNIDFAPLDFPADQLQQKLERLRINQALWDSQADIQEAFDESGEGARDLDTTDEFARQGGYINFKRGGRSAEGSFRHRLLSPGFVADTSEMLPEESLQASTPKQFPTIRTQATNPYEDEYQEDLDLGSPSLPRAPFPSPDKRQAMPGIAQDQSSGNPLKLFGPYDTFTNQTLLRRISQFEDGSSEDSIQHKPSNVADNEEPSPEAKAAPFANPPKLVPRSLSGTFGGGDLEGYQFNSDVSYTADESGISGKENVSPKLQPPFNFIPGEGSPDGSPEVLVRRRREQTRSISLRRHSKTSSIKGIRPMGAAQSSPYADGGSKSDDAAWESKRPRTSPSKDPTPKRRRTLHRSDIAYGRENLAGIDFASQKIQNIMGKKRRDSRPGDFDLAEPSVLAGRSILVPRTPSGKLKQGAFVSEDDESTLAESPRNSPNRQDKGDDTDGVRKPSIRTQDFVDQAAQIMAMIRNQVHPTGLSSVDESAAEHGENSPSLSNDFGSDSTREPLSRPPSREGKSAVPRPPQRQEDPTLSARLKKYQEASDMGDIISSSIRSLGLAKDALFADKLAQSQAHEGADQRRGSYALSADEGEIISDIPNVRISTNPAHDNSPPGPPRDYPSNGSGVSTGRSYPTGSSRGSDSRRVIMPESVSHLIPERVGSMRLDRDSNVWIKNKEGKVAKAANVLPSDSDEDPFASIPDLTVDLSKEMQNLRLTSARKEKAFFSPEQKRAAPQSPSVSVAGKSSKGFIPPSPEAVAQSPGVASSPAGDEPELQDGSPTPVPAGPEADSDDDDDLGDSAEQVRRRNVTISFSSPVASIIRDARPKSQDENPEEDVSPAGSPPGQHAPGPAVTQTPTSGTRSALKNGGRTQSQSREGFVPRPVSRIDEQDEDSTVELPHYESYNQQLSIIGETSMMSHKTPECRSVSLIWNGTPGNGALSVRGGGGDDSAMIGQNVGRLSLSPLSEFTLHNAEQPYGLEVSYVMGKRHMETGDGSKKVMSMTIGNLVEKLAEVEPYEPFWEDLEELDLQDKQLTSLHMLDEFCGKVVTLDASRNALGHLDGVPQSVRQLKASHNMLTELTSWDHLLNLQYVDVSGNDLGSLSGLKNLVHLRSLRADRNRLTNLDGLDCHDGLLTLRARDNEIQEVDFAALQLSRLTELDLAGNHISAVHNLELAPQLGRLKLSRNRLDKFSVRGGSGDSSSISLKALRHLDVSDNELTVLDVTGLPGLHSVHADRNRITELRGFSHARRLDSLSLREQHSGSERMNLDFLAAVYEVRKLFLSGNYLGAFTPRVDFLNLQLLELANCGLDALAPDIGQLMPNLRTLNVNLNAIADLSPLRYIPRLKKLLAAGNRLADSTAVTKLLTDFPHLTTLDLRDNPVTMGFYAPPLQQQQQQQQALATTAKSGDGEDEGEGKSSAFELPEVDEGRDETFAGRLDQATRLRRRLHQVVFVACCKRLRRLDGLSVRRERVLKRDDVLDALVREGVLPGDVTGEQQQEQQQEREG